ncbi:MAG TPA: YciI family protein [Planctomycetota bacterium]|nr:YciI family protein [Planctomycetota bacterium]
MRFLGLLKADESSEAGELPSPELMARMGAFMEEVTKAGVLLATDGLHPSSKGARVKVEKGKATVIDGPFTESKELVASYAVLEVKSKAEAVEWTRRFLAALGSGEVELRQIQEPGDFPADVFPPEAAAHEASLREEMGRKAGPR